VIQVQETDRLWEEIVYIAYHLHWSLDSILELDHQTRARVIKQIADINIRLDGEALIEDNGEDWQD
jgi:uncharacterized protein DUF6760